jgi:hypothetical protein
MGFYKKYRLPILITVGVLSSFIISIAIDKIMKKLKSKNLIVKGNFTALNCDELHAFQSTSGKIVGNMNVIVNKALEEFYQSGKNPTIEKVNVIMDAKNLKVSWEVEISESKDKKAWVGFTSRGSAGSNAFVRANSVSAGQDPKTILKKIKSTFNEDDAEIKTIFELFYNMSNTGTALGKCPTRQFFYGYTKPKKFPPILKKIS